MNDARHDNTERITVAQYLARGHNDPLIAFSTGRVHIVLEMGSFDHVHETLCRSATSIPAKFRGGDEMCPRCLREVRS